MAKAKVGKYAPHGTFEHQKIRGQWYVVFCYADHFPVAIIKPVRLKWRAAQVARLLNATVE